MSAENAPERRRHERRLGTDGSFWRALKGERRVEDRRRDAVAADATPPVSGAPAPTGAQAAVPTSVAAPVAAPASARTTAPAPPPVSPPDTVPADGATDARAGDRPEVSSPSRSEIRPEDRPDGRPDGRPAPSAADARREALRGMLQAAEARQDRIGRKRRPVLAEGARVRVVRGDLAGLAGVILDADYIECRVLLRLEERERPCWVPFSRVGPI